MHQLLENIWDFVVQIIMKGGEKAEILDVMIGTGMIVIAIMTGTTVGMTEIVTITVSRETIGIGIGEHHLVQVLGIRLVEEAIHVVLLVAAEEQAEEQEALVEWETMRMLALMRLAGKNTLKRTFKIKPFLESKSMHYEQNIEEKYVVFEEDLAQEQNKCRVFYNYKRYQALLILHVKFQYLANTMSNDA